MNERPILFSAPMVRAILEGRKAQTRRVAKVPDDARQVAYYAPPGGRSRDGWADPGVNYWTDRGNHIDPCPHGQAGDRLWVKETWRPRVAHSCAMDACDCADVYVEYAADGEVRWHRDAEIDRTHPDWTMPKAAHRGNVSPLYMPRWASRITLELTDVRVERVQSISQADIIAEGVTVPVDAATGNALIDISTKNGPGAFLNREQFRDPEAIVRAHWAALWCQVNGRASWDANPWVWALTFKRVEAVA